MKSKHYLLWSAYDFMQLGSSEDIITNNRIQDNSGNLAFHTSVVRALMTEGTVIKSVFFKNEHMIPDSFITEANETCDAFILPLADAFRPGYLTTLRALIKLIRGLKIPCIVTSIGCHFNSLNIFSSKNSWDADARDFVAAVLDKSQVIGVRGEETLAYLKRLGFTPEKDVRVIGCPSMFFYGSYLPQPIVSDLNRESLCMVNTKLINMPCVHDYISRSCAALPNYIYVAQRIEEIRFMHSGTDGDPKRYKGLPAYYPLFKDRTNAQERRTAIGFTDFPTWINEMKKATLSYGTNIHGAIPAILAGIPSIVIEKDRRVAEIANYFEMASIPVKDTVGHGDIRDKYEKADFTAVVRGHKKRFERYLTMLHENGLETIYDENTECTPFSAPWDRIHDQQIKNGIVTFEGQVPSGHWIGGLPAYFPMYAKLLKEKL